jgi:uncharacterized protein (TIGR00661 family)
MPKRDAPVKNILVAPLDWGLGHATRCIPIIHELLKYPLNVIIAASGRQKTLLQFEFPNLEFINIPAYNIRYGAGRFASTLKLIFQTPRILNVIKKENQWLAGIVFRKKIDAVISDNRYGLYHRDIPSIFISHQLQIKSLVASAGEAMLRSWQYQFINRFQQCWVPDFEDAVNLAGDLSHPRVMPKIPVSYIGALSRFENRPLPSKYHLLVLLSGPEPQRTILEGKLLQQLADFQKPVLFVRGLPGEKKQDHVFDQKIRDYPNRKIHFENHLVAEELNKAMIESKLVLSRSGYTTVMDIAALQKKSILIPTPGQTEQEYLAESLEQKGIACSFVQKDFLLKDALRKAAVFHYRLPVKMNFKHYRNAVNEFVVQLNR